MEKAIGDFLEASLDELSHLVPWRLEARPKAKIFEFSQYAHLAEIKGLVKKYPELELTLGGDYVVKPDLIIARSPLTDEDINQERQVVSPGGLPQHTPARESGDFGQGRDLLHASVSCKWSLRSDRAQNARTESLNLIRNRKGHLPHIVLVTMEPTLGRLQSIALGTGDVDCVYHGALPELQDTLDELAVDFESSKWKGYVAALENMVRGGRLRDISDLPFDLLT